MKKVLIGLGLASLITVSSYAQNDYYLKGGVGISKTQTLDNTKGSGSTYENLPFDSETFENYSIGLGYKINDYYNLELMLQHTPSFDLSGSNFQDDGGYDPDIIYNASIKYTSIMINNIFSLDELLNKSWTLKPYFGIGLGFTKYDYENYSLFIKSTNTRFPISSSSDTNFTWKAIIGSTYPLTDRIDFDLSYAYSDYGTFESGKKSPGLPDLQKGYEIDMKAHEVLFALRYNF